MNHAVRAWLRLQAAIWLVLGRHGRASGIFDTLVHRFGCDHALASRAHLHAQAGRLESALADYGALLARRPADARAWFNQGFVLEQLQRWHPALRSFEEAVRLSPKLDRAWYGMALVLIRLRRFDEALQALQRNIELQPMSPHGWHQLARVHLQADRAEEARRIVRHLRAFDPYAAGQLERESGLLAGAGCDPLLQPQGADA